MFGGKDLISLGFKPGPHFKDMLELANSRGELNIEELEKLLPPPTINLQSGVPFNILMDSFDKDEIENVDSVVKTMEELVKTPMVKSAAVLPDGCPTGHKGTIPVGGVVCSEAIHPGMHSADVCCSVYMSVFKDLSPEQVLNSIHKNTHFGPGGRKDFSLPKHLNDKINSNNITKNFIDVANSHLGTQGDGNHFSFVGTLQSSGETALVTHHGSRGFGAKVYKIGLNTANGFRKKLSPDTLFINSWIPVDTKEFDEYWEALQIVREWTKENHKVLHESVGKPDYSFWNEHNFVFRKTDGLIYHAKGSTPAFPNWSEDSVGMSLIPLNLAEPVLITRGLDNSKSLGFAPHGAGRNLSRTEYKKRDNLSFEEETKGIDFRFWTGNIDLSEMPSAYKKASEVRKQIKKYDLASVVDEVIPYGGIMAGDCFKNAFWRK